MNREHYRELLAQRHALDVGIEHYEKGIMAYREMLEKMYVERESIEEKIRNHERRVLVKDGISIS